MSGIYFKLCLSFVWLLLYKLVTSLRFCGLVIYTPLHSTDSPPGLSQEELLEELKQKKKVEVDPHTGKIFAYVYTSEDERFHCLEKVFDMFEFDKEEGESIAEKAVKVD